MLGGEVDALLKANGLPFQGSDSETDIADEQALRRFCQERMGGRVSWILNCAAYTAVDQAEEEPQAAFRVNAQGARNLAELASSLDARLIHISTDYVFDGRKRQPYVEEDTPAPLGIYGESKLQGERAVQAANRRHFILRTAWLYGRKGNNFVQTMLKLFRTSAVVKVVSDQTGSPTNAGDLARMILHIVVADGQQYGIYHYTNEGLTTWHGFALEILEQARRLGLVPDRVEIQAIDTASYPAKAHRPLQACLSKHKIKETFGVSIRLWQDALREYLSELKALL